MPQRNCTYTLKKSFKQSKTIVLPVEMPHYCHLVKDKREFRLFLDHMIAQLPELFPEAITVGYHLHDKRASKKLEGVVIRRIKLVQSDETNKAQVYSIVPSAVLPYMSGLTDEVEKALFLLRFGVPFGALTYVFGRNDSYWYRQSCHFGRYGIVETTIQDKNQIPDHLLADEKHSKINRKKCYIATTVGDDCVLGAAVSMSANEQALTTAYKTFKDEVDLFDDEYQPQTVNTDGWFATQNAWVTLFPCIVIIECFLHAYISIRARCKRKYKAVWGDIQEKVWDIYHATSATTFQKQVQAFSLWAKEHVDGTALDKINKLCRKADRFIIAFDHPNAYRTSNMIDRHMEPMNRWLKSMRYFHGHLTSAERQVRGWALFHNFSPYCPRSKISEEWISPAHKLNGKKYHDNWLHNLLISTSGSPVLFLSHKKQ